MPRPTCGCSVRLCGGGSVRRLLSVIAFSPLVAASNSSDTANRAASTWRAVPQPTVQPTEHLALPLPDDTASLAGLAGLRRPGSLAGSTEQLHALMQQLPNNTEVMLRLAGVAVRPDAAVEARVEALLVLQELVEDLDKAHCVCTACALHISLRTCSVRTPAPAPAPAKS